MLRHYAHGPADEEARTIPADEVADSYYCRHVLAVCLGDDGKLTPARVARNTVEPFTQATLRAPRRTFAGRRRLQ
jgi:hypothetical protein